VSVGFQNPVNRVLQWTESQLLPLTLDHQKPRADVLWKGKSDIEIDTDGLHALVTSPVIVGDYLYGICSYGQLRCLNARTGARVWERPATAA
jgi:hypothetical protein